MFRAVGKLGLDLSMSTVLTSVTPENFGGELGIERNFGSARRSGFHALQLRSSQRAIGCFPSTSTSKWNTRRLIRRANSCCTQVGISTAGNYMIGYPMRLHEMHAPILMAKHHVEQGLSTLTFLR